MAVSSYDSAAFGIDQFLVWENIAVADATATNRADALTKLNQAMFEVFRGVYQDEQGRVQFHNWSFLNTLDTTTHSFAADAYTDDMPSDWDGQVEPVVYAYDSSNSKSGLELGRISNHDLERKRRDSTTSGTPQYFTIRQKAFTAAGGSTWELCIHPPTNTASTVIKSRYRVDPAALTDSSSVYPRGLPGMMDLIVQVAKAREERFVGQVGEIGPERKEANLKFLQLVRLDQEVVGDKHKQTSLTQYSSGLDV